MSAACEARQWDAEQGHINCSEIGAYFGVKLGTFFVKFATESSHSFSLFDLIFQKLMVGCTFVCLTLKTAAILPIYRRHDCVA